MGFAVLVLLAPVICPMLYFCVVDAERRSPGRRGSHRSRTPDVARWALAAVMLATVVAGVGLAILNLHLVMTGIAVVLVGSGTLIWLAQSAMEEVAGSI